MNDERISVFFMFIKMIVSKFKTVNLFKIETVFYKSLIIVCLTVIIVFLGSCKTCKCPAYSHLELKSSVKPCVISV